MKKETRIKLNNFIANMDKLYVTMRDILEMFNNDEELANVLDNASDYPFRGSLKDATSNVARWVESANRQVKMVLFADDLLNQCHNVSAIMDGDIYTDDALYCLNMVIGALKSHKDIEWGSEE